MNSLSVKILEFIDTKDEIDISLFINIVKNYYYNNELPSKEQENKMNEWFNLNNKKDIETFLSNISDNQYDKMIEFVQLNNKKFDNINDTGALPHNKKCNLPVFMGSLDKIKNSSDYLNWKKKLKTSDIIVTEKLDGISALLSLNIINGKKEVKLYTRGNGKIGCDISHLVKYINLTDQINDTFISYKNSLPINIRGELLISKFVNDNLNLRNIVSGLVHIKEITGDIILKLKDVDFVSYRLYDCNYNFISQLEKLDDITFNIPQYKLLKNPSFESLQDVLSEFTDESRYQIDGIVVSHNDIYNQDPVDKNPEHSIAIKNTGESKQTKVLEIEWNVSKHGVYKPRIKIQPININGANIEWVTGFNAKYIKDNDIGKGALLEVERSGDVIPNIKNVLKGTKAELPDGNWKWNKTGVDIVIEDDKNNEMEIKKLLTFFQELECPSLGPKTIQTLYENGFETVVDVLNLTKQDLLNTDKFKEKSAENVLSGIKTAINFLSNINNENLYILMYASGTFGFGFGSKKIKLILDKYPNIIDLYKDNDRDIWINNLKNIKGILEQSDAFIDNINKYKMFILSIKNYVKFTNIVNTINKIHDNNSSKGIIVMSGFRDKLLKQTLEENGYTVNDNVTKETTIVIYNEDDTSSKCQKAKKMGIKLISKHDIFDVLNIQ
jgi:DNA ligase (NAD+)